MARFSIAITLTFATLAAVSPSALASDFDVTQWHLQNRVGNFLTQRVAGSVNSAVQNPFTNSITHNHLNSIVDAEYDYIWNETTGQFNVIVDLAAQGVRWYESSSFNSIFVIANTDLLLTVSGQFNYDLPVGSDRMAGAGASVRIVNGPVIASQGLGVDTGEGDPASGTFNINFTQLLPQSSPGQRYDIRTSFSLLSDTNGTTALGFANGFINFSLTPVPEPTSIGLLSVGAFAVLRRRQRS